MARLLSRPRRQDDQRGGSVMRADAPALSLEDLAEMLRRQRLGDYGYETRLPIVWSCLTFIVKRLRTVPVRATYADGSEARLPSWVREPYPGTTYQDVISAAVYSLLHYGNWYLMPLRDRRNVTVAVAYPDPREVTIDEWAWQQGEVRYLYGGQPVSTEIHHWRWFSRPGQPMGLGALDAMRVAASIGDASQDYIRRHFEQGAQLQYILTSKTPLGEQSMLDVAAQIQANMQGPDNAWRPLIADGFGIESVQMTAEQAQFLELAQWTDSKIAGQIYHVDPTLLGLQTAGSSLTYTNAVDRESNLWRDCLDPIATLIEDAWSALATEPITIDLDSSAVLAGSVRDRVDVALKMAEINSKAGVTVYDGNDIRAVSGHLARPELSFEAMESAAQERRMLAAQISDRAGGGEDEEEDDDG